MAAVAVASFRWSRIVEMFSRARLYSSSNKEKWVYSHQEIIDIVEHMQSLSLLKHEGGLSSSDTEQVQSVNYLNTHIMLCLCAG